MLVFAQEENPGARIIIKTHPETRAGHREGHYGPDDERDHITLLDQPVSPWKLFEGAMGVYTVSSGLGFEAIYAGHNPRVFGQPFYGGWGLTRDENPVPRRQRKLTRAQLFAATMILYPTWYDPYRDRLCELEDVIATLQAQTRAWREDRFGYVASGMRMWKRKPLQQVFGAQRKIRFQDDPSKAAGIAVAEGRKHLVWASKAPENATNALRVEDGFLRSRGLGAELVPPMSLVVDDLGIYYDPSRENRLDRMISQATHLPVERLRRAERLIRKLTRNRISKYNLNSNDLPVLPEGHRILVPGQVEDDASILKGAGEVRTNLALLEAARAANPNAVILFKPHPDVEAGLRPGALPEGQTSAADMVLRGCDPIDLIEACDEVWTMTSLLGFEALLRGKAVTCLGTPFYAGWGLTRDHAPALTWRSAQPSLAALVHATLIDYPRYHDPVTNAPCPVEVVVDRLISESPVRSGLGLRLLSKVQGIFASYAHIWR